MKKLFCFLVLIHLVACASSRTKPPPALHSSTLQKTAFNSQETLNKPYVILVSIDGYRPDYTKKFSPPTLSKIAHEGATAPKGMLPVFPSKTFPNHLSLVTGRYAENHGIVANYFYDFSRPSGKQLYQLSDSSAVGDGSWYQAKPLWVLAENQGMRSACFFWPGSEAEIAGVRPTYYKKYDRKITNADRTDGVLAWLKLPAEVRPHFITLYFSDVDSKGHEFGPDSPEVKQAVMDIDLQIGRLLQGIQGLPFGVDLIIVSDHGMAKIDPKKYVYLDELVDLSGVTVGDTGPELAIYAGGTQPEQLARIETTYQTLKKHEHHHHYKVYRRAELPRFYHLRNNARVGDLYVITPLPYSVGVHDARFHPPFATHGYDAKRFHEMNATFYAFGPDIQPKKLRPFMNIDVYPFLTQLLDLKNTEPFDGNPLTLKRVVKTKHISEAH